MYAHQKMIYVYVPQSRLDSCVCASSQPGLALGPNLCPGPRSDRPSVGSPYADLGLVRMLGSMFSASFLKYLDLVA